jgi:hypothetical protein
VAQIARLPDLPMPEIKALWRELFGADTPTHNRQFLERRIAHRLQENAFRKSNPELLDRNQRRIEFLMQEKKSKKPKKRDGEIRLMPGTSFTREYQCVEHRVTVTQDGRFDYQGRIYGSLSMIAREITGTRWSGPLFFGLKAQARTTKTTKAKMGGAK